MKMTLAVETEDMDSNTQTKSFLKNTPRKMSDHEIETSPSVSDEVAWQIKPVIDPLSQQLAHLCELMRELRNEQVNRRHEETASSRAASSSLGSIGRSDTWAQCILTEASHGPMAFLHRLVTGFARVGTGVQCCAVVSYHVSPGRKISYI